MMSISYKKDTSTFLINPTDEQFKQELVSLSNKDLNYLDGCETLVSGFVILNDSISQTLPGKSIIIVNPCNDWNHILLLKNNVILYDFTDDF